MTGDGLHFSELCLMARSPLHFRSAMDAVVVREQTRAMRVGTAAHEQVLGPHSGHGSVMVFHGQARRGGEWEEFVEANPGKILLTQSEWNESIPIAAAVTSDPVARSILYASDSMRYEVPLRWEEAGYHCVTHGIDVVGPDFIADLKTTSTSEPLRFQRLGANMHYHAQAAFYQSGARANGITADNVYVIGVETSPPYPVTVLRVSENMLDRGRRTYAKWLERLRVCEGDDHWPSYSQTIVDWEIAEWMVEDDDG